jgi:acetylglutamate kinase
MKRTSVSRTYLIADARERAVIPFLEAEFHAHAFIVRQVTTADYLVCRMLPGEAAVVLDGRVPHAMLIEVFTARGAGTLIRRA